MVDYELKEAKQLGVEKMFALTFQLEFFQHLGFRHIDKKLLPQKKIWEDCVNCPFFQTAKKNLS